MHGADYRPPAQHHHGLRQDPRDGGRKGEKSHPSARGSSACSVKIITRNEIGDDHHELVSAFSCLGSACKFYSSCRVNMCCLHTRNKSPYRFQTSCMPSSTQRETHQTRANNV